MIKIGADFLARLKQWAVGFMPRERQQVLEERTRAELRELQARIGEVEAELAELKKKIARTRDRERRR